MKMIRVGMLASLALLFCIDVPIQAQCGPGGCSPGIGRRGASVSFGTSSYPSYSAVPSYTYAAPSGGCSGGASAYYMPQMSYPAYGAPQACPTCPQPQQAAPAPPMPQATSDPMVLASDGRWYPLSAWSRPQATYQQPAQYAAVPAYYSAPVQPQYNAYVVETRSAAPMYAAAPQSYAGSVMYAGVTVGAAGGPRGVHRERHVIRDR